MERFDRMATPRMTDGVSLNTKDLLIDSEKVKLIRLLGCDEKYRNGKASDFEWLAEWERILPLCRGTGAAKLYEKECEWLQIPFDSDALAKWKLGNEAIWNGRLPKSSLPTDEIRLHRFVSDFINLNREKRPSFPDLVEAVKKAEQTLNIEKVHWILELPDAPFYRPNPYAAEQAWSRIICDEKCNLSDECAVLMQLLISGILNPLPSGERVLHLYTLGGYDTVFEYLNYLKERKLFRGTVCFGIFPDTAARAFDRLAQASSADVRVIPELIFSVADFGEGLAERMDALFRRYPATGVSFGGVLTDSLLYGAVHQILKDVLPPQVYEVGGGCGGCGGCDERNF